MKIKIMKTIASAVVLSAVTNMAWAAGTTAGVNIENTASISYAVGGATQTPIESSETGNSTPGVGNGTSTDFLVDKKIDLTVSPASDVNVTPNTTGNVLTFTVTNDGNSPEDFAFVVDSTVGGDFDANTCTAAPATISNLAVDTATNVTVTCNIPNSGTADNGGAAGAGVVENSKESVVDLLATVTGVSETPGADTANVDTVFADDVGTPTDGAARNAKHSATGKYIINTADVSVAKTSAVVKMVVNGADVTAAAGAKRIPGATVEYTITVSNSGTAPVAADGIVISDAVPANMTYDSCSFSGDGITGCAQSGGTVSSTPAPAGFSLAAGQSAILKFKAIVD